MIILVNSFSYAFNLEPASMVFNNTMTDAQTQTSPLAAWFGRKKGVQHFINDVRRYASALIIKNQAHIGTAIDHQLFIGNFNCLCLMRARVFLVKGISRVAHYVEKDLLDLLRVSYNFRQSESLNPSSG